MDSDLKRRVEALDTEALKELSAFVSMVLRQRTSSSVQSAEPLAYTVMADQLRYRGHASVPFQSFARSKVYPRFKAAVKELDQYVDHYFRPSSRADRLKVYHILFNLLLQWMVEQCGIPASYNSIVNAMTRIPSLVDVQFPGYREAGCLEVLMKRNAETE